MTDEPQPRNREQRRAKRFRPASKARQDNLRTQRENDRGFLSETPNAPPEVPDEATTENDKRTVAPGAGGATESGERTPHHEGLHGGPGRET
jgi:hypothetical protein